MDYKKMLIIIIVLIIVVNTNFVNALKQEKTAAEEITITLACGAAGQELELHKKAVAIYEREHPNVNIEIWDTPNSTTDRTELYLQFLENQSSEIDIYHIDVVYLGDLADHLLDLKEYGADKVIDEYFSANIKNNTINNHLLAIPWRMGAGLLYYRTDLLQKYGYNHPPQTWSELEAMAEKIQAGERAAGNKNFTGYVWQGDDYEGLTCNALEWVYSHNGGTIVSKDRKVTINNQQAIKALNRAKNWIGTISPPSVIGMKEEDVRSIWQSGQAAFMRNWPYAYSLSKGEDSAVQGRFDVAPLPAGEEGQGAAALGGWQLAVSKYSKHKEVAAEAALFLASKKVQKMRAVEGSLNPTIKSLYQDSEVLEHNEIFAKLYDVFLNAVPRPSTVTAPNYIEVSQSFYETVHNILTDKQETKLALQQLEKRLAEITGYKAQRELQ